MIDYDKHIFNIDIVCDNPTTGSLLVSEPFLRERWFRHSVIYTIEYEKENTSMGFVLNHRTGLCVSDIIQDAKISHRIPIYCGGPMSQDQLYYLHTLGDIIPGAKYVADGIYVGGDFEMIIGYIKSNMPTEGILRFFLGYSGWSSNQLDEEISNRVWAVGKVDCAKDVLSGGGDSYWHKQVRRLGEKYKSWLYHPKNPQSN